MIARLFAIETPLPAAKKEIRTIQQRLTPARRAGDYAQAMMDLGAAICTPKRPACALCPLNDDCAAHAAGSEERYPLKAEKAERPVRYGAAFVVTRPDGAVLLHRREDSGLLGGMAEVPGTEWASRIRDFAPAVDATDSSRVARGRGDGGSRVYAFQAGTECVLRRGRPTGKSTGGVLVGAASEPSRRGAAQRDEEGDRGGVAGGNAALQQRTGSVNTIRHIVFDLGKVLLEWDPERPYRRLIPDDQARKHFLTNVCNPDWNNEQDRGRTWREAEDLLIAEHPQHAEMIRAYRKHWAEMLPTEVDGTVAILEALLAQGRDVTALTNFAADTFEEAREMYPFLDRFRGVTVSGRIRVMKPDLAIYRHHAETFGLDPAATLFFDDNAANVAGARDAGWNAEQFVGAGKMRDDLDRYGIALA